MITEKAYVLDTSKPSDKNIVVHVFLPKNDKRHTDYYKCGNQSSADNLVKALNRQTDI